MAVRWNKDKCMRCGGCVGVCPKSALELEECGIDADIKDCISCSTCEKFCPVGALRVEKAGKKK